MSHQTLIRASRSRSCIAHWEAVENGDIRLLRVSSDMGPLPDIGHLTGPGVVFPDLDTLRRAVTAAMKGPTGDTLDRVMLSRSAYDRWNALAAEAVKTLPVATDLAAIPDERARAITGGRLLIWVDLPGGKKIQLTLEKEEWAWAPQQREH